MSSRLKRFVRPLALPVLHLWQGLSNLVRHPWYLRRQTLAREERARQEKELIESGPPVLQDVHGTRFVLDPWDRPRVLEIVQRRPDSADFKAIAALVSPGAVAIDIGAHIGLYSVLLSRLCGPAGKVWAFEPVPETCWKLRQTLALNRCGNVEAVEAAVGAADGKVKMNIFAPEHSEWNTLGRPSMALSESVSVTPEASIAVSAVTLDAFCSARGIDRVNFLKVDVEGFEAAVFKGAERLLRSRCVNYICFEISQDPLKGAGMKSRDVFAALEAFGYCVFELARESGRFRGPIHDTSEYWANFYASYTDLADNGVGAPR